MKRLNHKEVIHKVNNLYSTESYQSGKFTHFKKNGVEIGYIEQIPKTKNYLQTILVNFFDFEDKETNDKIVTTIEQLYKEQRDKEGMKYALELRGNNIIKAVLI
jgi:hypothetical protein